MSYRYRDSAPATLALLEERCSQVNKELSKINEKISATSDIASLRRAAMVHAASIGRHVVRFSVCKPVENGMHALLYLYLIWLILISRLLS
jgi:hypothetical protein